MTKKHSKENLQKLVQTAVFLAIILLLAFIQLGLIKTAGIEITLLMIPVAIGAILCGPGAGAILGFAFGFISFSQCLGGIFGSSIFGAALLTIDPWLTALVCFLPRILAGFLTGLIFNQISKRGKRLWHYAVASVIAPVLNTVLFTGALCACFYNTSYIQGIAQKLGSSNIFKFILLFVGLNGLIEIVVSIIVTLPCAKVISKVVK